MYSVDGDAAMDTTGMVILPEGKVDTDEPSCSTRQTGVSCVEVPTTKEPSACQSKLSAVPPSSFAGLEMLVRRKSPERSRSTTPLSTSPPLIIAAWAPEVDQRLTEISPLRESSSEGAT